MAWPQPPAPLRISTGVTEPTLIHSVNVETSHILSHGSGQDQVVTVDMIVDENGKPAHVKVVKSSDRFTDGGIIDAVNQYRYKPATLDGSAIPMAVTLNFNIR